MAEDYAKLVDRFMAVYRSQAAMPEMLHRLCRYRQFVEAELCYIRDQSQQIIPLQHNRIQLTLLGVAMMQAARGVPIRIVELKARKGGSSTLWKTIEGFLCAHYPNQVGLMLAHVPDSTGEIFQISKVMFEHYVIESTPMAHRFRFPNGSRFYCHTAGGESVGAGGTPSMLHMSEVALWVKNKVSTRYSATESVPMDPLTIIVQESTARGREEFYETYEAARNPDHPYEPIFIPWFLDDRLAAPVAGGLDLDEEEQEIHRLARDEYGIELPMGAYQWRREKILDIGPVLFRQEYPSTAQEAIECHSDLILPGMRSCVIDRLPFNYEHTDAGCRVGGMDYGYHDPTVFIAACYIDQVLYIVDVYRAVQQLARDHVDAVFDNHTYYCDPSATEGRFEVQQALRDAGRVDTRLVLAPRKKIGTARGFVEAEWEAVQKLIRTGRLKIMADVADQIILEADNLAWNPTTGLPHMVRSESWGHFDTLSALKYLVMGISHGPVGSPVIVDTRPDRIRMDRRSEFRL